MTAKNRIAKYLSTFIEYFFADSGRLYCRAAGCQLCDHRL